MNTVGLQSIDLLFFLIIYIVKKILPFDEDTIDTGAILSIKL